MPEKENEFCTKSDYLTPIQIAKKFGLDEATAYKTLKKLYLIRATILVKKKSPRPMVICARYSHSVKNNDMPYRLRSDALDEFSEYLKKQQTKEK